MLDQAQAQTATTPTLLLLQDPSFLEGFTDGRLACQENAYGDDRQWDESDIIRFIRKEISFQMRKRERSLDIATGDETLPIIHHVGFVMGYLDGVLSQDQQ